MTTIKYGENLVTDFYYGDLPVQAIRRGDTLVWSRSPVCSIWDYIGWLSDWFFEGIEGIAAGLGGLVETLWSDGLTGIIDGVGATVANLVALIPGAAGALNNIGALVSVIPTTLADAYCSALDSVGGLITGTIPDGLLGIFNAIPVIAGQFVEFVLNIPATLVEVVSLIGTIPVFSTLGQLLGLLPWPDGSRNDPVNLIVDAVGAVLGFITCGQITLNESSGEEGLVEAALNFTVGALGGLARMLIPDGLVSLPTQTARLRHQYTTADDGHVELQVVHVGDPGYTTQVLRRYSDDGSGQDGVGIDMTGSDLSIVARIAETETLVPGGSYFSGDIIRLDQAADVHTLTRNGEVVATWDDAGQTAARGAGTRSVGLVMQGAKEMLGPRRFSASLAYVDAA